MALKLTLVVEVDLEALVGAKISDETVDGIGIDRLGLVPCQTQ